ncbi:MAG: DUF922 domain-containing protein, partial [Verrucomicrobia bacterium]|nr:DUF922 domain-containing protein [Verrucomicrobiota bacterium]
MFATRKRCGARLMVAASIVAALELAAQPAPGRDAASQRGTAVPIPNVIRTDYYQVRGATAEALLASIRNNQPSTNHASTVWRINWDYDYQLKPDECILRSFKIRVVVQFTLPQWIDSQHADKALQAEWNRYVGALRLHEGGHAGFGIAAAKEMARLVNSRDWRAPHLFLVA